MSLKCPSCGSFDIDHDPARGDAACVECGQVLEQNLIVNEVTFAEDSRGRSNMVGQHVRADGRPSYNAMPGYTRQATELTLSNGRRRLVQIVASLKLNSHHTDAAHRLFKLAVERNFHKGRRLANVCCACLYIVCRSEQTPHMLLDFADVLETNVYVLGSTFLKLIRVLSVQLPIIDPSLYIHRFASKLEFGDRTHGVAITALRIVARMHRDWMSHGRRPSSICGAALICAAGIHGFHRGLSDVCRIVRVGNVALKERLVELNHTPTAALTGREIDAGGGDDGKEDTLTVFGDACNPPAFDRLQRRKLEKRKKLFRDGVDDGIEEEMRRVLESAEMRQLDDEAEDEARAEVEAVIKARKAIVDAGDVSEGDAELSDLDDDDAKQYINTEAEYEEKRVMWTEMNKDYLERQERLEKMKRDRPEEYKKLRPGKTGKKKKSDKGKGEEHVEAPVRKASKKLNYSVLQSLEGENAMALGDGLVPSVQ